MKKQGFIAFTSLLIISAVALLVATSAALLGVGAAKSSLDHKKGQETLFVAQSCLESALLQLRNTATYTGGSLNVGDGSCTITVSGAGTNRTINIQATIPGPPLFVRKLQAAVKRTGNSLNLLTWQEI